LRFESSNDGLVLPKLGTEKGGGRIAVKGGENGGETLKLSRGEVGKTDERRGRAVRRPRRTERYPTALGSAVEVLTRDEWERAPRRGEERRERRTAKREEEGERACEA
jgi:hypothetical protein